MMLRKMSFQTNPLRNSLILSTISRPPCSAILLSVSREAKSDIWVMATTMATKAPAAMRVFLNTFFWATSLNPSFCTNAMNLNNPNNPIIGTTTCAITKAIIGVLNLL